MAATECCRLLPGFGARRVLGMGIALGAIGAVAPLRALDHAMRVMASGALASESPGRNRSDGVGRMAEALEVFHDQGRKARRRRGCPDQRTVFTGS